MERAAESSNQLATFESRESEALPVVSAKVFRTPEVPKSAQVIQVDFGRDSIATAPLSHAVHGSLQFIAWSFLLPAGVFIARFTKSLGREQVGPHPHNHCLRWLVLVTHNCLE